MSGRTIPLTRRGIGRTALLAGLAALLLAIAGAGDDAAADGRRRGWDHGFRGPRFHGPGVFVGPRLYVGPRVYPYYGPHYYGSYYAYPYYYDPYYYGYVAPPIVVTPPPVVVTPPPTSYVERPQPATQYWHYCQNPAGYYPDVQRCPGGWIQVAPRPAQ